MPNVLDTNTDSYVRDVNTAAAADFFTVAVVSDTQLPWDETSKTAQQGTSTVADLWRNSRSYNLNLVQAINSMQSTLSTSSSPLAFTVMNGDLTAFFHPEQVSEFRAFYDSGFDWAYPNVLKTPVYLGLGNHDYENNVGDCSSYSLDTNRCAKNAINLIRGSVFLGYTKGMPANTIESFDAGSLAYSWNHGVFHFVQLHNSPAYEIPSLNISKSFEWLKADLTRAKARGQTVVINVHKPEGAMSPEFLEAIDDQPVAVIFAGHLHESAGLYQQISTPKSKRFIPIFLSGSADRSTFLQVDFENHTSQRLLRITLMGTEGGQAQAKGAPTIVTALP